MIEDLLFLLGNIQSSLGVSCIQQVTYFHLELDLRMGTSLNLYMKY